MQEHQHDHAEHGHSQEEVQENPEYLKRLLEHFADKYKAATQRKERCEELMRRKSTKKWAPEKVAKMVRRLMAATNEIKECESSLDQVAHRLSQHGVEVEVKSRSEGLTTMVQP